jgi:DNA-directed RNA polymerase subunit alpha
MCVNESLHFFPKLRVLKGSNVVFKIIIEPLPSGYGITFGNSLRRVLLSSISGFSPVSVKIENYLHEFDSSLYVYEDYIDIISNLKKVVFKNIGLRDTVTISLNKKGPCQVVASDFVLPHDVDILTPTESIAYLSSEKALLNIEVILKNGIGYNKVVSKNDRPIGWVSVDSFFTPVKFVEYSVEDVHVNDQVFDSLFFLVETNGSESAENVFYKAVSIIRDGFSLFRGESNKNGSIENNDFISLLNFSNSSSDSRDKSYLTNKEV